MSSVSVLSVFDALLVSRVSRHAQEQLGQVDDAVTSMANNQELKKARHTAAQEKRDLILNRKLQGKLTREIRKGRFVTGETAAKLEQQRLSRLPEDERRAEIAKQLKSEQEGAYEAAADQAGGADGVRTRAARSVCSVLKVWVVLTLRSRGILVLCRKARSHGTCLENWKSK